MLSANVTHAILMDGGPSCGSNVLLKEEGWPSGGFKRGYGVSAALLKRNNITVFSSFDEFNISAFLSSALKNYTQKEGLKNLKDSPKFKPFFS